MTPEQIRAAIESARKGIAKYAQLMSILPTCNVASDPDFQRQYNGFYRVQRRTQDWYKSYYALMERSKAAVPTFDHVLDEIHQATGRYEPSFASKLVATLDPTKPIWDIHVLANTGHVAPSYTDANKLTLTKASYQSIVAWYADFLESPDGKLCISEFDRMVPLHTGFTALKKVDFILWQMRSPA